MGEGRFKVVQVHPRKGLCPPIAPFQFLRVSGGNFRTRSERDQALTTHTAAQTYIDPCAPSSRYTEARTAPPLFLPNRPSDGANLGGTRQSRSASLKDPSSYRQLPPPSLAPSLCFPNAGQSRLGVPINSSKQPRATPAAKSAGIPQGGRGLERGPESA